MTYKKFVPLPLVAALWAAFAAPAHADFDIPAGSASTTGQALPGGTGNIGAGATLTLGGATHAITVTSNNTSVINNSGTINQTGTGRVVDSSANSPTLTVNNLLGGIMTANGNEVIRLNRAAGTYILNNQGTIWQTNTAPDSARAVKIDNTFANNNQVINGSADNRTALIRADGNDAIRLGNNVSLINYGTIISTSVVNTSCPDYISAQCANDFSAADGVAIENGAPNVVIQNYGSITGPRHGVDGGDPVSATASAALIGTERLSFTTTGTGGVVFERTAVGGATTTGVTIANPVVINYAGGTITGRNGSGVGLDGHGVVFNWGTISGNYAGAGNIYDHEGLGETIANGDGDGVDIDGVAYIENHGRIEGTGAGGRDSGGNPNGADGIAAGGGTIINHAGAVIFGQSKGILIDDGANGTDYVAQRGTSSANGSVVRILNDGTITGERSTAIGLVGNFDDVIVNGSTGTITGGAQSMRVDENGSTTPGAAIQMGAGNDSLINYGRIEGKNGLAIDMGTGNDTLKLLGGTVVGTINGGDGDDTLETGGTQSFASGTLNGFERFIVRNGATTFQYGLGMVTSAQIDAGASLRVNGAFGTTGDLTVNGRLAAAEGQALRTVNVGGNYSQGATGVLEARLGADGQSDKVVATGTANLASGATIQLVPLGYVADGASFTLVSGAGGLTATAADLQLVNNSMLVRYTLSTSGQDLLLTAQRTGNITDYAPAGQSGTANALQSLSQSGNGAMAPLLGALDTQTSAEGLTGALNQLSPETNLASFQAAQANASAVFSAMGSRMDQSRGGQNQASLNTGLAAGDAAGRRAWVQGLGAWGEQKARAGTNGYDINTWGVTAGLERDRSAREVMGVSVGLNEAKSEGTGVGAGDDVRVQAVSVGGYMSNTLAGGTTIDASVVLGHNSYDSQRRVAIGGLTQVLQGSYNGWQLGAQVEAGFPFAAGEFNGRWLAGARAGYLSTGSYSESGGSAALNVASNHASSFQSILGVELSRAMSNGNSMLVRARYLREFAGSPGTTASFVAGGPSFTSAGVKPNRDALQLGVGMRFQPSRAVSLTVNYDAELKNRYVAHQLSARAIWAF